ncbi:hypothetical protein [Comamonas serinivorans]|uniref:hypothetical protein n=1 Tax=Comamonas serinivorans TaxID=1082851 RepID=UPI001F26E240|nr:hypothetical protein [Comamonas serinivorans]
MVERANASPYGLGGTVWGKDEALATSVANRARECGPTSRQRSGWCQHHVRP